MQIYGIDLAKEKFDVSFFDLTSKKVSNQPSHKVVTNNLKGIGKFFKGLPSDAVLVAEHTGVYGDTLLKCCMDCNVKIAFVGGYVIHRYRATLTVPRRMFWIVHCSEILERDILIS